MGKSKTIHEAFVECQTTTSIHTELISALKKSYDKAEDKDEFHQEFLQHLKYAMVVFKREPAVERVLEFTTKFAVSAADSGEAAAPCSADEGGDTETSKEMGDLLLFVFNFMLKVHGSRDRAVRYRACQMINKLLNSMGPEADIDDDLYNGIYECMLVRLRDVEAVVRVQAVLALARLQDPEDANCPVIAAYMYLLQCDLSHDVRRAVLVSIAPSAKTLPSILATTRDVKESVRKLAYQILSEKVHIRALTIAQRVKLLKDGLSDRTDAVKDTCATKLLQAWLRTFEGNILDFLKCLDVENSSDDTAELALNVIFNKVTPAELVDNFELLNENHVIPASDLTCEGALYWRHLCAFLKTQGTAGEVLLDNMVPTVSDFCEYLQSFVKALNASVEDANETIVEELLKNEFIAKQLLHITALLDLSDEVGRKRLDKTVQEMMVAPYVPSPLIKQLVELFNRLHRNDEERITIMAEIIADVREPITTVEVEIPDDEKRKKELKLASLRVQLNETRDTLEDLVAKQDFKKAAEYKSMIEDLETSKANLMEQSNVSVYEKREEKNDPATLVKCLRIASEMMQQLSVTKLNPTLQTLVDTLVLPGIQNQDPAVRNLAVSCIGLASLLSKTFACQQLLLLMQISQVDQETIKVTALQAVFDLLHLYGLEAFKVDSALSSASDEEDSDDDKDDDENESEDGNKKEEQNKTAANSAVAILSGLLDSESSEIRTVAAEGMAKLLMAGRVSSPKLLKRLLILWHNPTTEEDLHLRQCLGSFFPVFAMAGRSQQECVEHAFIPTLQTLFDAPTTSPLAAINENNVATFLVHLTDHRNLKSAESQDNVEDSTVHDSLSLKLCNEILVGPDEAGVRTLCKTLNMLALSTTNQSLMKDLSLLADQMIEAVEEKLSNRQLVKFKQSIVKALNNDANTEVKTDHEMDRLSQDEGAVDSQEEDTQEEQEQPTGEKEQNKDSQETVGEGLSQESEELVTSQETEKSEETSQSQKSESPEVAPTKPAEPSTTSKRKTRGRAKSDKENTKSPETPQETTTPAEPPASGKRKTRGRAKSGKENTKSPETPQETTTPAEPPASGKRKTRGRAKSGKENTKSPETPQEITTPAEPPASGKRKTRGRAKSGKENTKSPETPQEITTPAEPPASGKRKTRGRAKSGKENTKSPETPQETTTPAEPPASGKRKTRGRAKSGKENTKSPETPQETTTPTEPPASGKRKTQGRAKSGKENTKSPETPQETTTPAEPPASGKRKTRGRAKSGKENTKSPETPQETTTPAEPPASGKRKTRGRAKSGKENTKSPETPQETTTPAEPPASGKRKTRGRAKSGKENTKSPEEETTTLAEPPASSKRKTRGRGVAKASKEVEERLADPEPEDSPIVEKSTRRTRGSKPSVSSSQNKPTFKTPTETTRSTRKGRTTKAAKKAEEIDDDILESPETIAVPMKRNIKKTKVNLAALLSNSESDAENVASKAATKHSTRSTRTTRRGGRARVLADLSNTDDEDF